MTDPIADMLTRLRNAVIAKHSRVDVPASKLKVEIARILEDEGYIQGFKMVDEKSPEAAKAAAPRQVIRIFLKYGPHGEKVITRRRAHQPARAPRVFPEHRSAAGAGRARHEHPDDFARRHDRTRRDARRRRRRSAVQRLVTEIG